MHRVTRILVFKNNKNFVSWNISIPRIRLTRTNPPPITRIVLFVRLYWDWNITSRSIYHNKTNPAWLIWGFIPNSLNLSNSPLQHVFSNPHILPCDPRRTACCCDFNFWAFHIEWNLFKNWIGQLLMKLQNLTLFQNRISSIFPFLFCFYNLKCFNCLCTLMLQFQFDFDSYVPNF